MMRVRAVLGALAVALPLALTAAPAQAAVPSIPLKCGMVVRSDAHVYLPKDLYCRTNFGLRVEYPEPEGGPIPTVSVDLRGHTLRGSSSNPDSRGITAFAFPGQAFLKVTNGRVENWNLGVGGDNNTQIIDVKLVGNKTGYFCNGYCLADRVYFKGSTSGMTVGAEANAFVRRSTISGNTTGISVIGQFHSATIERNTFAYNRTGVLIACNSDATLTSNKFISNGTNVNRESCD